MKKKIISVIAAFVLSANTASASILGTEIKGWSHDIAGGSQLYKTEFMSEQSGVGRQTEYYAKYTPNSDVLPVVVGGSSVWGVRNIAAAEELMKSNGITPLVGINATFFSFETGIPMGVSVSDGRIVTKDTSEYHTIGFNPDGTAFIAPLKITTLLRFGETELEISHINKYNQSTTPIINLFTPEFDSNNHNEVPSLTIVLSDIDGVLGIGEKVSGVVTEKFNYQGAIELSEGHLYITLNEDSDEMLYSQLNSLELGESVEIYSYSNDERWNDVTSAMGSVGDRLIENGTVRSGFEKGAAPRTAVGITESGEVIFYVLDGRQTGYSYGAKIETVAKRLKELGCVDAINLDGGGSTSISGILPGDSENKVLNSPSDGNFRKCSNYLFLKNANTPTDVLGGIYLYPFEEHYLSGYEEKITAKSVDTAFYPISTPDGVTIEVTAGEGEFDNQASVLKAKGSGKIEVTASLGDVRTKTYYNSYESPTDIVVKDSAGNEVRSLSVKKDDTLFFEFDAWYNGIKLKSNQDSFMLSVNEDVGFTEGNRLTITANEGEGVLSVSVGEFVKKIPISIQSVFPFADISEHWAKEQIKYVYDEGIISGYYTDDGLEFLPTKNITREEFAVIISRMLKINTENVTESNVNFADANNISDWSRRYVFALVNKGIIAGKSGDNKILFSPKTTLTRAEAITILSRVLNLDELSDNVFEDDREIPDWAKEAVYMMFERGFITGYPDNTIRPLKSVSRAEAAVMIYNIISRAF